ncbi:MAG: hypothetical protein C4537_01755 [Acholeplasma sp.]|jgi:hypothetical protein|nr:MAG: hypothetical protein C4537_01755 [Acholeplasma sp.]
MQYFFDFVLGSVSYFILTYFVYSIFGYKKKIAYGLLGIIFLSTVYQFIRLIPLTDNTSLLILVGVIEIGPVFFAYLIFSSLTGGIPLIKIKRKTRLKNLSTAVITKRSKVQTSYMVFAGGLIVGLLGYFLIADVMRYVVVILSAAFIVLGIILWIEQSKIIFERIVLFIGREKEHIYIFEVNKALSIDIPDFFKNENYIVDRIGEAIILNDQKQKSIDYLYWVATSDKIDVKDMPLIKIENLPYQEDLNRYEKYHIKRIWFQENRMGHAEYSKEKIIK